MAKHVVGSYLVVPRCAELELANQSHVDHQITHPNFVKEFSSSDARDSWSHLESAGPVESREGGPPRTSTCCPVNVCNSRIVPGDLPQPSPFAPAQRQIDVCCHATTSPYHEGLIGCLRVSWGDPDYQLTRFAWVDWVCEMSVFLDGCWAIHD